MWRDVIVCQEAARLMALGNAKMCLICELERERERGACGINGLSTTSRFSFRVGGRAGASLKLVGWALE